MPALSVVDAADQPAHDAERQAEVEPDAALDRGQQRQHQHAVAPDAQQRVGDQARRRPSASRPRPRTARQQEHARSAGAGCRSRALLAQRAERAGRRFDAGAGAQPRCGRRCSSPAIARPNAASLASGGEDRLDAAVVDDRDAVADRAQLGQLRRGDDQRQPALAIQRAQDARARAPSRRRRCRASARRPAACRARASWRARGRPSAGCRPRAAARAGAGRCSGCRARGSSRARARRTAPPSSRRSASIGPGVQEAALRLDRGERDVQLDALVGQDADAAPVLGDEREPARAIAARGSLSASGSPSLSTVPRAGIEAHQAVGDADLAVARRARRCRASRPARAVNEHALDPLARHVDRRGSSTSSAGAPPRRSRARSARDRPSPGGPPSARRCARRSWSWDRAARPPRRRAAP